MSTKTRFQKEAWGNSEMAYSTRICYGKKQIDVSLLSDTLWISAQQIGRVGSR